MMKKNNSERLDVCQIRMHLNRLSYDEFEHAVSQYNESTRRFHLSLGQMEWLKDEWALTKSVIFNASVVYVSGSVNFFQDEDRQITESLRVDVVAMYEKLRPRLAYSLENYAVLNKHFVRGAALGMSVSPGERSLTDRSWTEAGKESQVKCDEKLAASVIINAWQRYKLFKAAIVTENPDSPHVLSQILTATNEVSNTSVPVSLPDTPCMSW
jgi:hypothetical protein